MSAVVDMLCCLVFFFKQKTAYEMRISDWSSDVCSSDLHPDVEQRRVVGDRGICRRAVLVPLERGRARLGVVHVSGLEGDLTGLRIGDRVRAIGRASYRERVCQYV